MVFNASCYRLFFLLIILFLGSLISDIFTETHVEFSTSSTLQSFRNNENLPRDEHSEKVNTSLNRKQVNSSTDYQQANTISENLSSDNDLGGKKSNIQTGEKTRIDSIQSKKLQKWIASEKNKHVLLVQADNRNEFQASHKISYYHSSILGLAIFAQENQYAHIWVTGVPLSPKPGIAVGPYWNKVVAGSC